MKELEILRKQITEVDKKILDLISQRIELVEKVGKLKGKNGIAIVDKKREKKLLAILTKKGQDLKIDELTIKSIWKAIFKLAYKVEGEETK